MRLAPWKQSAWRQLVGMLVMAARLLRLLEHAHMPPERAPARAEQLSVTKQVAPPCHPIGSAQAALPPGAFKCRES